VEVRSPSWLFGDSGSGAAVKLAISLSRTNNVESADQKRSGATASRVSKGIRACEKDISMDPTGDRAKVHGKIPTESSRRIRLAHTVKLNTPESIHLPVFG
jgi:hypothetical protein